VDGLLPKSFFVCSETFSYKPKACSRRYQNSPPQAQTVDIACLLLRQGLLAKKRFNELLTRILVWATACRLLTATGDD
jgi:hypothetical protein